MKTDWIKAFLLGVIATLLAVLVFSKDSGTKVIAANGEGSSGGMIALINEETNDILLVDSSNKRMLLYGYSPSRGDLLLKGGRNFSYDLRVPDDFSSSKGVKAEDVKKALKN